MAKLFRRVNNRATYIIVDTPVFSCIQWLYLATVLGDSAVNILHSSESSKYAQDYVSSLNFFNAKHVLLAFQDSSHQLPDAGRLRDLAVTHGAVIQPIEFLPGNYYAFK